MTKCPPGMCNPSTTSSDGSCPCRYALAMHRVCLMTKEPSEPRQPESVIALFITAIAICAVVGFVKFVL